MGSSSFGRGGSEQGGRSTRVLGTGAILPFPWAINFGSGGGRDIDLSRQVRGPRSNGWQSMEVEGG